MNNEATQTTALWIIVRKDNGRQIGRKAFTNQDIAALHLPSVAQRYRLPNEALRVAEQIVPITR